eukprot:UN06986
MVDGRSKIDLPDISPIGFQSVQRYAYTHEIVLRFENAFDTYLASYLYGIDPVREKTLTYIKNHISFHNVCSLLSAIAYSLVDCKELVEEIYYFTDGQASEVP